MQVTQVHSLIVDEEVDGSRVLAGRVMMMAWQWQLPVDFAVVVVVEVVETEGWCGDWEGAVYRGGSLMASNLGAVVVSEGCGRGGFEGVYEGRVGGRVVDGEGRGGRRGECQGEGQREDVGEERGETEKDRRTWLLLGRREYQYRPTCEPGRGQFSSKDHGASRRETHIQAHILALWRFMRDPIDLGAAHLAELCIPYQRPSPSWSATLKAPLDRLNIPYASCSSRQTRTPSTCPRPSSR